MNRHEFHVIFMFIVTKHKITFMSLLCTITISGLVNPFVAQNIVNSIDGD